MYKIDYVTSTLNHAQSFLDTNFNTFINRIFFWNDYMIVYTTDSVVINKVTLADLVFYGEFTIN